MKRIRFSALGLMVLALAAGSALASDPVGVYAIIDKVVLEPGTGAPDRIQIWGIFSVAKPNDMNYYQDAQRGVLYYALKPGKEDLTRAEWVDLKQAAGTGKVIALGSRWVDKGPGRVRKAEDKLESPDTYPIASGLTRVRTDTDYAPIRALLTAGKH
ncbi:MAG: hypothetical protein ACR2L2_06310 [Acidobacteriota bacterium]